MITQVSFEQITESLAVPKGDITFYLPFFSPLSGYVIQLNEIIAGLFRN